MNSQEWDQRYATTDLVWGAGPNRFLVAEVEGLHQDVRWISAAVKAGMRFGLPNLAGR